MTKATVRIVAEVLPEIKEKAEFAAWKRRMSLKELIVYLIEELPEEKS